MSGRFSMEINGTRYTRLADVPPEYRALLVQLTPAASTTPPAAPLREPLQKARAQPDRGRQQQVLLEALRSVDPERAQRMEHTLSERNPRRGTGTLEVGSTPTPRPREGARIQDVGTTVAAGDRGGMAIWALLAGVVVLSLVGWLLSA